MQEATFSIPNKQIEFGEKLGEGGFGEVYKAQWNHIDVAVKLLALKNMSESMVKEFEKEIKLHLSLRSPQIVQMYGVTSEQPYGMVMEYMENGSLDQYLQNNPPEKFSWSSKYQVALDTILGLFYLHQNKVIHRDLKSLNILIDKYVHAKLADFGLAKLRAETMSRTQVNTGLKGTAQWTAPELFLALEPEYNEKTDLFSYGIVLWELSSHDFPYKKANPHAISALVMNGVRETFPKGTPEAYEKLAKLCWDGKAENRPKVDEIIMSLKSMLGDKTSFSEPKNSSIYVSSYLTSGNQENKSGYLQSTNNTNSAGYLNSIANEPQSNKIAKSKSGNRKHKKDGHREKKGSTTGSKVMDVGAAHSATTSTNNSNSHYLSNSNQPQSSYLLSTIQGIPKPLPQKPSIKTLDHALFREIKSCVGHSLAIRSLVQLSDGTIASGSSDNMIRLWDPKTGSCLITLQGHSNPVTVLSPLPGGSLASGSSDNTIRLWDLKAGKCINTLQGHSAYINALIQLEDGTIASGSADKTIKLWELSTGKCLKTLEGHLAEVKSVIRLSNGNLASGSVDCTIKVWDPKTAKCISTLKGHSKTIYSLVQILDGNLASGSEDKTIKVWEPNTGKCINTLQEHSGLVYTLAQLSDGNLASGSYDKTIKLWDLKTGNCINTLHGHLNKVNTLTPLSGGTLASGSWDKTIKLWDLKTGKCLNTLQGHKSDISTVIQLLDGTLASGSEDKTIRIWG